MITINKDDKKEFALKLLKDSYEKLGRTPKKEDFSFDEVRYIKQKLGPWPRALEAAGLKAPPAVSAKDKSRIKRERAKQRRKEAKKLQSDTIQKDI